MQLAIRSQDALRGDDGRGIENLFPAAFQHSHHGGAIECAGCRQNSVRGRARNFFRHRSSFLPAAEAVAGECTFGEDGQLCAGKRRLLHTAQDLLKVVLLGEYLDVHLNGCHLHLRLLYD